jgi:hypothetical protein
MIGQTLSDGTTIAVATDAQGDLAIVGSTGGREYGQGKEVELCDRSSTSCAPVPAASVWTGNPLKCPPQGCVATKFLSYYNQIAWRNQFSWWSPSKL